MNSSSPIAVLIGTILLAAGGGAQPAQGKVDSEFQHMRETYEVLETLPVYIVTRRDGKTVSGTGFLFSHNLTPDRRYLVTAKHVVSDAEKAVAYIPVAQSGKLKRTIELAFEPKLVQPPSVDTSQSLTGNLFLWKDYDIACVIITFQSLREAYGDSGIHTFGSIKLDQCVEWSDLFAGQPISFLGFPLGMRVGGYRPVLRMGWLAAVDSASSTLIADAQFYDGSSGSPVVLDPRDPTNRNPFSSGRFFVGVVTSYRPLIKSLIDPKSGTVGMIQTENSGIGVILPAPAIRDFLGELGKY